MPHTHPPQPDDAPSDALSEDLIRKLAHACALDPPSEEIGALREDLARLLENLAKLPEVGAGAHREGLSDVRGDFRGEFRGGLSMPFASPRADEPGETLDREAALSQAPRRVEGFFAVPRVDLGRGKGGVGV